MKGRRRHEPENRGDRRLTPRYRPVQLAKAAPCQAGCANCGDIRGWIGLVAQRRKTGHTRAEAYARAWSRIAEVNPFPATLGRICPHPCEEHCNRAERDGPLAINALERYLGDYGIRAALPLPRCPVEDTPEWIGIVGAGPSGLSFAYQMARRGYRVTVYDAREEAGGMLRYGVPDYRLPQPVLDAEIGKIADLGVELQLGVRVGRDVSLERLRERHDYLYIGIGAQHGMLLNLPGLDGSGVLTGTDYLERVNRGLAIDLGQRVVVVGGGNTAIDAARCARRAGAGVTLLYRRGREEMPAIAREVDEAIEEGVEAILLASPVAILRSPEGKLTAVRALRMQLGAPDSSGRRAPVPVEGSEFDVPADTLIAAISQVPSLDGLGPLEHRGDWLVADELGIVGDNLQAGGDVLGLGIAGDAIRQGRRAAEALLERLHGLTASGPGTEPGEAVGVSQVRFETKARCEAAQVPTLPAEMRVSAGMSESTGTISETEFLSEVERCYSCGLCFGCGQCAMFCTVGCFTPVDEPGHGSYFELNLDSCQECGKCVEVCPCGFLEVL